MATTFNTLGINLNIIEGLKKQDINNPTEIQEATIPLAMENKDIIAQAQTGSGKTLAYLLPIFHKIDSSKREMQAIILAPTHELVVQIDKQIKLLASNSGVPVTSTVIIGEGNIKRQLEKLKEKPHIIVGSTGRILKLIKDRKISAHTVKTIVIDEGDKLLDDKNFDGVKDVIKTTMRDRQLMTFSATINEKALTVAQSIMKEPVIVKVESETLANPNITHMCFLTEQREKVEVLRKLIASINPEKAIVFINNSEVIDVVTSKLKYHKIKAYSIYGSASKEERKKAIDDFKGGRLQLLISSDLSARGLDIKDVTHIFNLDLPEDTKEYLHRVGRTGRAGKTGTAISIVNEKELPLIKKMERDFNISIEAKDIYKGKIMSVKKPFLKKPSLNNSNNDSKDNSNINNKTKSNTIRKPNKY